MNRIFDALNLSPTTPGSDEIPPAPPTSFSHLIHPVLRTDVQAYEDFRSLLEVSRKSQPSSRVTSGTFSGLGIGNLANRDQSQLPERMSSTGSTSSLSTSNIYQSSPSTPNLPTSATSSFSGRDTPVIGTPLKETAFISVHLRKILSLHYVLTLHLVCLGSPEGQLSTACVKEN